MENKEGKLKVLLISPTPPPAGGIATWTKRYSQSEMARKHTVHIANSAITGARIDNLEKKTIVHEIKRFISIYCSVKNKLKKVNFDIVHINSACSTFGMIRDYLLLQKAKKGKSKVIVHFHCDTSYMVRGIISGYLFREICRSTDHIFCLNSASEKHIQYISGKSSSKIPNFIELNRIRKKQISERIETIIYVGHVTKQKGCIDLISIAEKMPTNNFLIVGKESEEFKSMAKTQNIQMFGEVAKEDVERLMQTADLLLFPTYTEGFPNVILEAMACGLPIISTPVGAIPDMVENSGGILVHPGDLDGYVHAIHTLQNKDLRLGMSLWNQDKTLTSYTTEIVMKNIFMEYEKIVKNHVEAVFTEQPETIKL